MSRTSMFARLQSTSRQTDILELKYMKDMAGTSSVLLELLNLVLTILYSRLRIILNVTQ